MFEKEVLIDGRGHLFGRLASIVAAQLIRGQHVTVVRCEEILRSGSLFRNHLYWKATEHRRINTNPRRGLQALHCSLTHVLEITPRHAPPQDPPRCHRPRQAEGLRRYASTL